MKAGLLRQQRGMVLLLVLVVMALLSALLSEFAFSTLVDLRLAETFRDRSRAYYLARGGIRAGQMILREDQNNYDGPDEMWGQGVANFPVGEGFLTIDITDQDGRLAINSLVVGNNPQSVQKERFLRLFEILEFPDGPDLVAALIDWIDTDDQEYVQDGLLGAESNEYLSQDPGYSARNGPLRSLEELSLVRGFTPEVVAQLKPHVTIYGDSGVNLNTATPEVIATLYFDEEDRITLEEARDIASARDIEPFRDLEDFKQEFPGLWQLFPTSGELDYSIGFKSDFYRVRSQAWVNEGTRVIEAVVAKPQNNILFLRVQ